MKEKEIKDIELEEVNGGAVDDGEFIQAPPVVSSIEELVIPKELKVIDKPAFSAVEPVIIKPEYEKKTEKDTFVPLPY